MSNNKQVVGNTEKLVESERRKLTLFVSCGIYY